MPSSKRSAKVQTNWQAYAEIDINSVKVTLGQFGPNQALLANFEPVSLTSHEIPEGQSLPVEKPLVVQVDMAQALYLALDRIFGTHEETGVSDVLRETLQKEQARVDKVLDRFLSTERE